MDNTINETNKFVKWIFIDHRDEAKGQAKQNTKKELKEMKKWMSSTDFSCTGYTGDAALV